MNTVQESIRGKSHQQTCRAGQIWKWLLGSVFALALAPVSANEVSHQDLDAALRANVDDGFVTYPGLASNEAYQRYVMWLKSVDAETLTDTKDILAFWINAYNALAIKGILDGGSPSSFFGRIGYFKNTTYDVGGRNISLYDLEHKILRPLGEPRIHFAINCASKSCPILRSEVYTPAQLEAQLDDAARVFVNDTSRNQFDREERVARLSKIFDWFDEDFGDGEQAILNYVANYVKDASLAAELRGGDWTIDHLDYDWSLNGQSPDS